MPSYRQIQGWAARDAAEKKRSEEIDASMREAENRRKAGIPQLIAEQNRLAKQLADKEWADFIRTEPKRLIMEPTPAWDTPQYVGTQSVAEITAAIRSAWAQFVNENGLEGASFTEGYLKQFIRQNVCDMTKAETYHSAVAFIKARLTRPTPAPEPAPQEREREANGRFAAKPETNPHPVDDHPRSAYQLWDAAQAKREAEKEMSPLFRGAVKEIVDDCGGKEFSADNMRWLFNAVSTSGLDWSRESIRKVFFARYANEVPPEAMTESEWVACHGNDLTSKEFARQFKVARSYNDGEQS